MLNLSVVVIESAVANASADFALEYNVVLMNTPVAKSFHQVH
jgi:hypothetical protein